MTMRRRLLVLSLVAAGALGIGAALAAADEKKPARDKPPSLAGDKRPPAKPEPFRPLGAYAGKVLLVEDGGKLMRLRVFGQTPVLRYTPGSSGSC
jgi:hypothetical protein